MRQPDQQAEFRAYLLNRKRTNLPQSSFNNAKSSINSHMAASFTKKSHDSVVKLNKPVQFDKFIQSSLIPVEYVRVDKLKKIKLQDVTLIAPIVQQSLRKDLILRKAFDRKIQQKQYE